MTVMDLILNLGYLFLVGYGILQIENLILNLKSKIYKKIKKEGK